MFAVSRLAKVEIEPWEKGDVMVKSIVEVHLIHEVTGITTTCPIGPLFYSILPGFPFMGTFKQYEI